MRLINVFTLEMEVFISDVIPEYAIFSHMWGPQEVTLQDWMDRSTAVAMAGYAKIHGACLQAAREGIKYVWVDTNCIDKTSSAELSEAINSMFRWYRHSKVCYVYLADIDTPVEEDSTRAAFRSSRWFTRGWTLQELLAPENVVFYSKDWTLIGTKQELCEHISAATGVHQIYLQNPEILFSASIARRISWMSNRVTTRIEDLAYCMLGIFDINMALLYGEGQKAFLRLQEEIIRVSDDQSIFCWGYSPPYVPTSWWNILAPHPAAFRHSGNYIPQPEDGSFTSYSITNAGLSLTLPILYTCSGVCAMLDVGWHPQAVDSDGSLSRSQQRIAIHLTRSDKTGRRTRIGHPQGPVSILLPKNSPKEQLHLRCRGILKDFSPDPLTVLKTGRMHDYISQPTESLFITFNCEVKFKWALTHEAIAPAHFDEFANSLKLPRNETRSGIHLGFEIPDIAQFVLFIAGFQARDRPMRWYVEAAEPMRRAYNKDAKTQAKVTEELDKIEQRPVSAYSSTSIGSIGTNNVFAFCHGLLHSTGADSPGSSLHLMVVSKVGARRDWVNHRYGRGIAEVPKLLYPPIPNEGRVRGFLTSLDWAHSEEIRNKFKMTES
jgi:hypothetical protein